MALLQRCTDSSNLVNAHVHGGQRALAHISTRAHLPGLVPVRPELWYNQPMAEPASLFDQIDEAAEAEAIKRARADVAAGRVVPHAEVVKWLRSWGKPNELPCPTPKA